MPTYTQTLARHILKRAATQQEYASARTQLLALKDRLMRRELSFEDAASRYSEDGSATSGGSLGWSSPGNFVPAFEAAMNGLQPGQLSEPVETEFGLHLIQVMERRNVEMTQEQVKFQIEAQLREQKMPKALEDWMLNLRGRAFIEMREPPQ
jgi:peptidyl-prolyl cis-trans isomerase SurA